MDEYEALVESTYGVYTPRRFRSLRQKAGLSPRGLAARMRVPVYAIRRWEDPRDPMCPSVEQWDSANLICESLAKGQDGRVRTFYALAA